MTTTWTVLSTLLVGIGGYIALEYVGRPLRGFFDLRRKVGAQLWRSVKADSSEELDAPRLQAEKDNLRDLASQLISFGETEPVSWIVKFLGYDAVMAGHHLNHMADQLGSLEDDRLDNMLEVLKALRIRSGAFPKHLFER